MSLAKSLGRHWAVSGLLLVALVAGAAAATNPTDAIPQAVGDAAAPPARDDFYRPPSPLPAGAPGTIIRSRSVTVPADPAGLVPAPVHAWQMLYLSTSADGRPTAVSATVLVPDAPWDGASRPLVSYAVGTHGLGDHCTPSYKLRTGNENESGLIGQALARRWAVVVTDYEGLGTPGTHTYAVGVSEGHAVLDAARAAFGLAEAGLQAGGPVGIWGYSQGGQAAAWAGEQASTYAPELRVVGVAAGGVPAELVAVTRHLDGGPGAGLVMAGAIGYGAAYPELALDAMLNETGKAAARRIAESCTEEIFASHGSHRMAEYTTDPDPLEDPRWRARLAENQAGLSAPAAPVLLYHGTADELIPFAVGEQLGAAYRSLGTLVDWWPLPQLGHVPAALAGAPIAVSWLDSRFAERDG